MYRYCLQTLFVAHRILPRFPEGWRGRASIASPAFKDYLWGNC